MEWAAHLGGLLPGLLGGGRWKARGEDGRGRVLVLRQRDLRAPGHFQDVKRRKFIHSQ